MIPWGEVVKHKKVVKHLGMPGCGRCSRTGGSAHPFPRLNPTVLRCPVPRAFVCVLCRPGQGFDFLERKAKPPSTTEEINSVLRLKTDQQTGGAPLLALLEKGPHRDCERSDGRRLARVALLSSTRCSFLLDLRFGLIGCLLLFLQSLFRRLIGLRSRYIRGHRAGVGRLGNAACTLLLRQFA